MPFEADAPVRHVNLGRGRVLSDLGNSVVVKFDIAGVQQCDPADLQVFWSPQARLERGIWDAPLPVFLRAQAHAVQSVNAIWGVFSRSRIKLLPHQLWVCRKVLEQWPTRWLVADDVGLGKTIEAGLILSSLLGSGRVRRFLLLTPASLVEQWQERLRLMFDIRVTRYAPDGDTERSDFWNSTHQVVASAETVRLDRRGRWGRMLEAEPWDLVMVDEAHHLNHDEGRGIALAFQLVDALAAENRVRSMVFFTGTPHRGKTFGFLALLRLLRPDTFDPRQPAPAQLARVGEVMIRNNKQRVTTMDGQPLFKPFTVEWETHSHSVVEAAFYEKLTEYIGTGKAYASTLDPSKQRMAILVLITMQKLASSSVAAVRKALHRRLARLRAATGPEAAEALRRALTELQALAEANDLYDADRRTRLEESVAELTGAMTLGPLEIPALEELLQAADAVQEETKISRLIETIESRFPDESVLIFTEYKATQALVMTALMRRYGDDSVTFINGDELIDGLGRGTTTSVRKRRLEAADDFNAGRVRFLVSTEAAGEGVDLQHRCAALIHVDLPWNPMRLHQRGGRVHRIGQKRAVRAVTLYNPDTVEGRIWECLREKLHRITEALRGAMDDPEDMLQVVMGMASGATFDGLFTSAPDAPKDRLQEWFDAKTASFGGQDAVTLVRTMFGSASRFDFASSQADLPQVDLRDLAPFVRGALVFANRRPEVNGDEVATITPDSWKEREPLLAPRYDSLRFSREATTPREAQQIAGVGHRLVDVALAVCEQLEESVAQASGLDAPVIVFAVRDELTDRKTAVARVTFGVAGTDPGFHLLRDWEVVLAMNGALERPGALQRGKSEERPDESARALAHLKAAVEWFEGKLPSLGLQFRRPASEVIGVFWPQGA